MRARDLGIRIGDLPTGPDNAITAVDGVRDNDGNQQRDRSRPAP